MFYIGQQVTTEFGAGVVRESSPRRVFVELDNGESINVVTGTPGYDRIKAVSTHSVPTELA